MENSYRSWQRAELLLASEENHWRLLKSRGCSSSAGKHELQSLVRHGTGEKWKRRKMMWGSGDRSRPSGGSRGKAPGRGLRAMPPEAESFFSMSSQTTAFWSMKIIFASQQALCLDQTFTWPFSKLHWKCHSCAQKIRYQQKSVPSDSNSQKFSKSWDT